MDSDYKYSDITEKIIGCAMKVHSYLGNGFQEVIYQRCLAIEFANAGIRVFPRIGVCHYSIMIKKWVQGEQIL